MLIVPAHNNRFYASRADELLAKPYIFNQLYLTYQTDEL